MKINLNFVQLVKLTPNNFHNESTSSSHESTSSHVTEDSFQTPTHPTNH
ncbi:unnamed protein product [Meloidogyne enterolobii]|uniref:Uncharacterized protein n=1 Tax=Meloidogyne enterolobii TaxID=390850 RepID=A0ACB1B603_MELEN